MRQGYFIVVLAHSIHGKLRRVHVPHQFVYMVLALAFFGAISLFGMVGSYVRMSWKISNYNSLRQEMDTLRSRYKMLQQEAKVKDEHMASLQALASETQIAVGLKRQIEGPTDMASEGTIMPPSYKETLEQYNFLKSATLSSFHSGYVAQFQLNTTPSLWPVAGRVSSPFGGRLNPFAQGGQYHPGVDLQAGFGTPVRVTGDGVVRMAEWSGGYGKLIVIDHGSSVQTYYAHLSRFSVVSGQEVRRGEVIGYSGATGWVTAPHLHYEVRVGGNPVNPYRYLHNAATTVTAKREFPF